MRARNPFFGSSTNRNGTVSPRRRATAASQARAFSDSGRRVADDEVEALGRELIEHTANAFGGKGFLVTSLRGRQYVQRFEPLILDQRLLERAFGLDDVDEVINHAPLAPHD